MTSQHADAPRSTRLDDGDDRTADALIGLLDEQAGAAQIAQVVARTWIDIERALSPVLGKRGVAALYTRSLHVSGDTHPWLSDIQGNSTSGIDFEMLQRTFAERGAAEAFSAAGKLLRAFCVLLASLVGTSLTGRLLRPVVADPAPRPSPRAI